MELWIEKKYIEDIVRAISRISLKGIIHPALKLSRIVIKDGLFTISTTNLSLAVIVSVPVIINDEHEYFVDTNSFERVLSGMTNSESIQFLFKESFVEIKTKTAKAKIPYQNGEDMPSIPTVNGSDITLPASNLKRAFQITIPGASTTDIKPELASLFVTFKNNSITSVATDAFQLIEYTEQVTTTKEISFLLPAKEASDILKIIENVDGALHGAYSETLFEIKTKTTTIIAKLTMGLFPDYTAIIPKEEKSQVRFLKGDLESALKFLMQLKSENNHIHFSVQKENIIFSLKNSSGGDSEYIINGDLTGDSFSGTILAGHLKTLASSNPGEGINISFYGENKPFIGSAAQGNSFRYLMMPVSL